MKNRPAQRPKPEIKPDRRGAAATPLKSPGEALPASSLRKLEKIGQSIAGLRTELDRLAEERAREKARERARERTAKPARRPS
jgi:hypothetical protein